MDLSGRKFGKYELTEHLGHGGMAEVYKAYQPGLDRSVAIKVLHSHLAKSPDFVTRFKREAKSIGRLQHKNILPVIDFDIEDGTYYMVMAYVQGDTLEAYMEASGAIPVPESLEIMGQLLDGIEYAHQQGMIHRDIKPGNIMFMDENHTHPVLTDFGLVRLVDEAGLTMSGATVGTPAYMPPESAKGEKVDKRGDLYGLGVVLFEMVTGDIPYKGDTPFAIIMQQVNDPLPPPREINPDLPDGVDSFLVKALAKEPSERFQTAAEMKAALVELHSNLVGGSTIINTASTKTTKTTAKVAKPKATKPSTTSTASANSKPWFPLVGAAIGVLLVAALTVGGLMMMGQSHEAEPDLLADATVAQTEGASAPTTEAVDAADDATDEAQVATVAPPTDTPVPTPTTGPRPVGRLRFIDSDDVKFGGIELQSSRIGEPPPGTHYELWLANEDQTDMLNLGSFAVFNGRVDFFAETTQNLIAKYNQLLISLETDDDTDETISDLIVFTGELPLDFIKQLRQMLPQDSGSGGFLLDNDVQTELVINHGGFVQDAIDADDYNEMRRHAEHVVNIIEGVQSDRFSDYDGDGLAQNPGDGVGIRGYMIAISETTKLAMAEVDDPDLDFMNEELLKAVEGNLMLSDQAVNQALQIFAADTIVEAQPMVDKLRPMLEGLLNGFDFDDNGLIEDTVDENMMARAYQTAGDMLDIKIFQTDVDISKAVSTLPAPSDPIVTVSGSQIGLLEFNNADELPASGFILRLENVPLPPADQHYELWLIGDGETVLNLGQFEVERGRVDFRGGADENLLSSYTQAKITLEPNDDSDETMSDQVVFVGTVTPGLIDLLQVLFAKSDQNEMGLLLGLDEQTRLVINHGGFVQEAVEADDYNEMRRHAEHVINILDGEEGDKFGDYDGDDLAQNPGDGVGVLRYLFAIESETDLVQPQNIPKQETQAIVDRFYRLNANNFAQVDQAINLATQILAADTVAEAQPTVEVLNQTLAELLTGSDFDGNGVIDPLKDEGGILAVYGYALLMGEMGIYESE